MGNVYVQCVIVVSNPPTFHIFFLPTLLSLCLLSFYFILLLRRDDKLEC